VSVLQPHRRFLIDVSRLVGRRAKGRLPTGIDRVCLAYVREFGDRGLAVLQWRGWRRVLSADDSQRLFELLLAPGPRFLKELAKLVRPSLLRAAPAGPRDAFIYLNVGHTELEGTGLAEWLERVHARAVYLVHDLIPLTHPEYCRPGEAQRHARRIETILRTAAGVVTNSAATLDALRHFARSRSLPMPRALAALIAPAQLAVDERGSVLQHPYFISVGTIEPRKNHWMLLHVWREMAEALGPAAPHLVLAGQRGWECENVVDLLERCVSLRGKVHELPSCPDAQLALHVRHARALLFPSFAEGFGLPLAEALMLGTPVLASELPAFAEIAGDIPEYLHPLDGKAWAQAVQDYAGPSHPRRQAQLARLAGFRAPTWETHFGQVRALLEELA
jgi:glycosyltransferase involved in cell wall biosynthesis